MEKSERSGFSVHQDDGLTVIRMKQYGYARFLIAAFLLVWLSGWTFGCVKLTKELVNNFEWFKLVYATPFFVAWLAVFTILIGIIALRTQIVLDRTHLRLVKTIGFFRWARSVPVNEIKDVKIATSVKNRRRSKGSQLERRKNRYVRFSPADID